MAVQTTYNQEPEIAVAGALACEHNEASIMSMFNAEASAEIPFGFGVKWGSATDAKSAKLPAAEADNVVGIVVRLHTYETGTGGELGTSGVKAGGKLNVLRRGVIWAVAEDACVPGDRLWVRCTVGGAGEVLGGLTNADEGTETIDATAQGTWLTAAAAGGLAKLSVDFTNK